MWWKGWEERGYLPGVCVEELDGRELCGVENGYDTLVLWENEVNEDPEFCIDIIKNHVKEFNIWTN